MPLVHTQKLPGTAGTDLFVAVEGVPIWKGYFGDFLLV
jgi:hypothetical protein